VPIVSFLKAACSLFLPPLCLGCEKHLEMDEKWVCKTCFLELVGNSTVAIRLFRASGQDLQVRYVTEYTPLVARLITSFKYCDRPGLVELLSLLLFSRLKGFLTGNMLLAPVPMHAAKLRERGYNQSELLCSRVSGLTGLAFRPDVLIKRAQTPSQVKLERHRRVRNLHGKLEANPHAPIEGRHIVIIDDVVTTGATLQECARALLARGARKVSACVVASSL